MYPVLREQLSEQHKTVAELAQEVGLSESSVYRRLRGEISWRLTEIIAVAMALNYPDALRLFSTVNYDTPQ